MKKNYEKPEIKIILLAAESIMTTSGEDLEGTWDEDEE